MFLDKIIADKRAEVARRQERVPLAELVAVVRDRPTPLDLAATLAGEGLSLIAEVKKASPSKGVLRADLDPVAVARTYARCGAAALTDLFNFKEPSVLRNAFFNCPSHQ